MCIGCGNVREPDDAVKDSGDGEATGAKINYRRESTLKTVI